MWGGGHGVHWVGEGRELFGQDGMHISDMLVVIAAGRGGPYMLSPLAGSPAAHLCVCTTGKHGVCNDNGWFAGCPPLVNMHLLYVGLHMFGCADGDCAVPTSPSPGCVSLV
jgi:hypothetical protein